MLKVSCSPLGRREIIQPAIWAHEFPRLENERFGYLPPKELWLWAVPWKAAR